MIELKIYNYEKYPTVADTTILNGKERRRERRKRERSR